MKVRKAIIPAAGLGTRFLPATKAMPKEMLPIVDKPAIQYIVEEAIASGIEDIIIVTGKGKRAIEDHFDHSVELEQNLIEKKKFDLLKEMRNISEMVNIHYIRQKEPKGLGHAIWTARKFIGNEPFAVLLGDDIVHSEVPSLKQMLDIFHTYNANVVGIQAVQRNEVNRYGIIDADFISDRLHKVNNLVEKPDINETPSNLAIMGRYILMPEIFDILENQETGVGGEIQLTDAIKTLGNKEDIYAYEFEGKRYDIGSKIEFVKAIIDFSLKREDLSKEILKYLESILEKNKVEA